jgi:hypothetical protein
MRGMRGIERDERDERERETPRLLLVSFSS